VARPIPVKTLVEMANLHVRGPAQKDCATEAMPVTLRRGHFAQESKLSTNRVEAFSDGVIAVSITSTKRKKQARSTRER